MTEDAQSTQKKVKDGEIQKASQRLPAFVCRYESLQKASHKRRGKYMGNGILIINSSAKNRVRFFRNKPYLKPLNKTNKIS